MKAIYNFLYTTLVGGVMFLIPLVVLIFITGKAFDLFRRLSAPFAKRFDEEIVLGFDGHNLIAAGALILFCFLAGLLFRMRLIRNSVDRLENNVLSYMPGYMLIKSLASDTLGTGDEQTMKPVMIKADDEIHFGFLIEKANDWSTVFIPDAPRMDAGEVKVVLSSSVTVVPAKLQAFKHAIGGYGRGGLQWVDVLGNARKV